MNVVLTSPKTSVSHNETVLHKYFNQPNGSTTFTIETMRTAYGEMNDEDDVSRQALNVDLKRFANIITPIPFDIMSIHKLIIARQLA